MALMDKVRSHHLTILLARKSVVMSLLMTGALLSAGASHAAPAGEGRVKFAKPVANSAYGEYLAGKYAVSRGDTMVAAEALISASKADPTNEGLREKLYRSPFER